MAVQSAQQLSMGMGEQILSYIVNCLIFIQIQQLKEVLSNSSDHSMRLAAMNEISSYEVYLG